MNQKSIAEQPPSGINISGHLDNHGFNTLNWWVIYAVWCKNSGWVRLFGRWYGIRWKPIEDALLFSERIGKRKTWCLGKHRFSILKPNRLWL